MQYLWIILALLCSAGCVTVTPVAPPSAVVTASAPAVAKEATKLFETRYDLRGYRESGDTLVRHEAHAVYRRTRVPLNVAEPLETSPREAFPPASFAPLPASAELNAELSTQRQVTVQLRAMQAALVEAEAKMSTQYAALVRQSADAIKLRAQLEAERLRLQNSVPATPAPTALAPASATIATPEVKW